MCEDPKSVCCNWLSQARRLRLPNMKTYMRILRVFVLWLKLSVSPLWVQRGLTGQSPNRTMQTTVGPTRQSPNQDRVQVLQHGALLHCYMSERRTNLDKLLSFYLRINKFLSRCEWKSRPKHVQGCHVCFRFPPEGLVCGRVCSRRTPNCIMYGYIYMCIWMHVWIQKYQVRPNIDLGTKSSH